MTVVVAVDGSDGAWNAIRPAAKEAAWRQARLIAVSVYRDDQAAGQPPGSPPSRDNGRAAAELALSEAVRDVLGPDAGQAGIVVDLTAVPGLAGRAIVDTAREARAQLIVLAVRAGIIMLPGTVSQFVLQHARCPVLLVPAGRVR